MTQRQFALWLYVGMSAIVLGVGFSNTHCICLPLKHSNIGVRANMFSDGVTDHVRT